MFSPDKWLANPSTGFYGHSIDQSLRFEDGDSPALSKAYSTAQTDTKKLTISVWVKRSNLGIRSTILYAVSGSAGKLSFQTTERKQIVTDRLVLMSTGFMLMALS